MEETKKRPSTATQRKSFIRGKVTQKPMTFKIDLDNWERLQVEVNKGRVINEAIREHYEDTEPPDANGR